jgi:hypothetical protein
MIKFVIICLSLMILTCCGDNDLVDQDNIELSSLYGNSFVLEVNRISEMPDVQFPFDDLQESDYEEVNEGVEYDVIFSEDGQTVAIEPDSINGQKTNNSAESVYYELGEGTVAGGRLIVWINNNQFEAELTVYGSGVPIIKSERGYLYPY